MCPIENAEAIRAYFQEKLNLYGLTPRGVDWNSQFAQEVRFEQLVKVCVPTKRFSILDYGCGFGSLVDYIRKKDWDFEYFGYDMVETMIINACELHKDHPEYVFTCDENRLPQVDFTVESGIFNIQVDPNANHWTEYVLDTLTTMNRLSVRGLAANFLTKYSDPEYMKPNLYYADPCLIFDYCKTHFSRNVTLLHDYDLYDFTILVHKNPKE